MVEDEEDEDEEDSFSGSQLLSDAEEGVSGARVTATQSASDITRASYIAM